MISTRYFTQAGQGNGVSELDRRIERGEGVGIVGESGSDKSVTARSIMDLIESPGRSPAAGSSTGTRTRPRRSGTAIPTPSSSSTCSRCPVRQALSEDTTDEPNEPEP